ncbi:MAG TPA: hypothetical protein VGL02_11425 [Streptomyces sp.]
MVPVGSGVAVWVGGSVGPAGVVGGAGVVAGGAPVGDCWAVGCGADEWGAAGVPGPAVFPPGFAETDGWVAPGEAVPETVAEGDIAPVKRRGRPCPPSLLDPSATLPALAGARGGAFGSDSLPALTHAAALAATSVTRTAERSAVRVVRLGTGSTCMHLGLGTGGCVRRTVVRPRASDG